MVGYSTGTGIEEETDMIGATNIIQQQQQQQ